jgi:hypothetical protein
MSQGRIDLFVAACLSGIMGHARSDNHSDVIAARALQIAISADKACSEHEKEEDARAEAAMDAELAAIRSAPTPLMDAAEAALGRMADKEAAELAAREAATRPGA